MTGTSSAVAVREHGALAIETGQTRWTEMQEAAFGQLGIADAPEGDKGVFLHVSQRTGLDPFSKQIYMIGRKEKKSEKRGSQWVDVWSVKYTIQTGIEGFRVMRSRAERLEGVRGILSRPVYYDREGKEFKVWFFQHPPVAVEMTYTVRDRNGVETPYTSILRFDEYRQTRKDANDNLVLTGQWATKPCHMLEKCTEADVYRKAFPQDFSGVQLDDAMPAPDPDAPPAQPERQRVTAAAARERRAQTVTSEVVDVTPNAASGDTDPAPAPEAAPGHDTAGSVSTDQIGAIWAKLTQDFGYKKDEKDQARTVCAYVVEHDLSTTTMLSKNEASRILDQLVEWQYQAEQAGEHPRTFMTALMMAQDAEPGGE